MRLLAPVLLLVLTCGPGFADIVRVTGRAAVRSVLLWKMRYTLPR
jgi:hypothetical protein